MTIIIRDAANTPRTITAIQVRDATNTPRTISEMWARDSNNVPRLVFSLVPPMTASATPNTVFGFTSGTGTATSDSTTVTPVGGLAPYTYAWTLLTFGSAITPTADSPTSATTTFTQTGIGIGDSTFAEWQCQVTDSSASPYTALAYVSSFWTDLT
ncbi:MAG: hypothetical protein V4657_07280 [Pseudomonadota bacterium]